MLKLFSTLKNLTIIPYLPAIQFETERLNMNTNLQEIVDQSDILIVAVPSAFIAKAFDEVNIKGIENKIIISAIKGVIPEYNQIRLNIFT